jgi:hypothetical protein
MISFIIGQLFINFKRGMVISPFYHYGMYSEVMKPKPLYGVYEVKVNDQLLSGKDFTPQQWDKIIQPIKYFHSLDSMKGLYEKDVKRLMLMLHITTDDKKFTSQCDAGLFYNYYKLYLQNILNKTIDSVEVSYRNYSFTGAKLNPIEEVFTLEQLCN